MKIDRHKNYYDFIIFFGILVDLFTLGDDTVCGSIPVYTAFVFLRNNIYL